MARHDKILEGMRRTQAGWKAADFSRLFVGFGFEEIDGAKHTKYRHPSYPQLWTMIARADPLSKEYAKVAIQLIDQLVALEEAARGRTGKRSRSPGSRHGDRRRGL